jgi:hypothetical protein
LLFVRSQFNYNKRWFATAPQRNRLPYSVARGQPSGASRPLLLIQSNWQGFTLFRTEYRVFRAVFPGKSGQLQRSL